MKIKILGCSGAVAKGFNTTSILINDTVLIDAGSAASTLSREEIMKVRHIFLTHAHIDHIKELPFIIDSLCLDIGHEIDIWGSRITIKAIKEHLFNGMLWPGLGHLGLDEKKCRFNVLTDKPLNLCGLELRIIDAIHSPGACSYMVSEGLSRAIFSGDTSFNEELFDIAEKHSRELKLFFVEASFPDSMCEVAGISGHLTPVIISRELTRFKDTRVIVYHIKPRYFDEVVKDIPDGMEYISGGEVFEI